MLKILICFLETTNQLKKINYDCFVICIIANEKNKGIGHFI